MKQPSLFSLFLRVLMLPGVRRSLLIAYSVIVSTLALALGIRSHEETSALATFITANGTTATSWSVAGPNGGTLNGSANTLTLAANNTLAGAAGTGSLAFGSMTGGTVLPTGGVQWSGGASGFVDFVDLAGDQLSMGSGMFVLNGPTAIAVDGADTKIGPSLATVIDIGNTETEPVINIGDQTSSAFQVINIGTAVASGDSTIILNSGGSYASFQASHVELFRLSPTFQPRNATSTLACGTGGTQTVAANSFGVTVTTGTLSSNCIIDFSTNGPTGFFIVDLSGATPGASFGIEFKNGSSTKTYLSSGVVAGTMALVWTHGANTLAVNY
jgi:hypothetical protein